MELPGSSYLYALGTFAITFAGFAAMIVVFRQVISGKLLNYDLFFVRAVLMRSFIVVACAMLPSMLSLFKISEVTIWRSSSLIAGLLQSAFVLTWKIRRKAVTGVPVPLTTHVHNGLQLLTAAFLVVGALGILFEPGPGPFAFGVTAFFFLSLTAYLISLEYLFGNFSSEKDSK